MMGRFIVFLMPVLCAGSLFAQAKYYEMTVKTLANPSTFPDAVFRMEEGASHMKGFEAQIKAVGFGGEGIKTIAVQNQELQEKLQAAMQKELGMKSSEKLDMLYRKLENNYKRLELAAGAPPEETSERNSRSISNRRQKNLQESAEFMKERAAAKAQEAYEKAKEEFKAFDELYQRAKRNKNIERSLVAELDEKIKKRYERHFKEAILSDGTLPFGTFCNVNLKKVSGNTAIIDFEYAISRMLGWVQGDGTNNNNAINTSIDMEYVELPKIKNVRIELGKPYCFQIARPEEQGGTLTQAQNATTIFATENTTKTIEAGLAEPSTKPNPLTVHGDYAQIRSKFKGVEKKVIRVIITLKND